MMVNTEYHKGYFCVYSSVFCQEGYCSGCEIYSKRPLAIKQADRNEVVKSRKAPNLALVH
jgi:hypothetical protein